MAGWCASANDSPAVEATGVNRFVGVFDDWCKTIFRSWPDGDVESAVGSARGLSGPASPCTETIPDERRPAGVVVEMEDGSHLVGELTQRYFPIRTTMAGPVRLPVRQLTWIMWSADHTTARFTMRDGDQLHGCPTLAIVGLNTATGLLKLPVRRIRCIRFLPARVMPLAFDRGLNST